MSGFLGYPEQVRTKVEDIDEFFETEMSSIHEELSRPVLHLPNSGGKRIRPVMFLLLAEGLGYGNYEDLIPIACAIESVHTATLIQDDLPCMDGDTMRRGTETVHEKYNNHTAILSANILKSKAYQWCTEAGIKDEQKTSISEEIDGSIIDLCVAQKNDIEFSGNLNNVTREEYFSVITGKTASLYRASARIAGIVCDSSDETIKTLSEFGRNFGICFQIADDIIDYTTREKNKFSDLKNKKLTIVSLKAANKSIPIFDEELSIERRVELIREEGCIEKSIEELEQYKRESERKLEELKRMSVSQNLDVLEDIIEANYNRALPD